jgi:hypothetical protein
VLFTIPSETILLRALQTTDTTQAIQNWASTLDSGDLQSAASTIETYPFAYRKAIMRALGPIARAAVWQRHIRAYEKLHPEFDANTVNALEAAASAITPRAMATPTDDDRAAIDAAATQLVSLIGRDQAEYLLVQLGPRDGTFASAEPISMKIANYVREKFVALARTSNCDCAMDFGCINYWYTCDNQQYCYPVDSWPACGWAWVEECDGSCH